MQPIDFCSRSLTLTPQHKKYANLKYNKLVSAVCQAASNTELIFNVYIGGSLALGEPSLMFDNGNLIGLNSDIDFFAVVKNPQELGEVVALFKKLASIEPDIPWSLHATLPLKIPNNLCFPSIDDVLLSINHPIVEKFPLAETMPPLKRQAKTMADLFICRTAVAIMPYYFTTHQYSKIQNNKTPFSKNEILKMLLSGLRLQFYGVIPGMHGISDLINSSCLALIQPVMEANLVYQLLTLREQYDAKMQLPLLDIYSFIRKAWLAKLNLVNTATDIDILNRLITSYFNLNMLVDFLLLLVAGLSFVVLTKNLETLAWVVGVIQQHELTYIQNHGYAGAIQKVLLLANSPVLDPVLLEETLIAIHALTLQAHTDYIKRFIVQA